MVLESICLFDLDHTLLPLDSDHAWGQYTTHMGWTDAENFAQRNDAFYRQYQQGELDIHAYVQFATQAARERGLQASTLAHQAFMRDVIEPAIRPEATALVQRHRAQFGPGKVVRLQQWVEQQGLTWAGIRSTFYSDSINDLPLLEKVNHPVATNPDARLRAVAQQRGWPILELFPSP